jgi:hypothetical protein
MMKKKSIFVLSISVMLAVIMALAKKKEQEIYKGLDWEVPLMGTSSFFSESLSGT